MEKKHSSSEFRNAWEFLLDTQFHSTSYSFSNYHKVTHANTHAFSYLNKAQSLYVAVHNSDIMSLETSEMQIQYLGIKKRILTFQLCLYFIPTISSMIQ